MKETCKKKLLGMQMSGTKVDKKISTLLLNTNEKIENIVDVSNLCSTSISTASRFFKKINYPSFKHFIFDYHDSESEDEIINNTSSTLFINEIYDLSHNIIKLLKNDLYILTSRRGKSIGKLLHERLNDGHIKNFLFRESMDNLDEFVSRTTNNTLILVSLSGYSNLFSKCIEAVSKMPENTRPNIIILTAAQWMKIFEKYPYISIGKIYNKKYDLDNWKDYNFALLDIMATVTIILNEIFDKKNDN